jgi:hypothetical protein
MRRLSPLVSIIGLLGCGDRNFNTPQLLNVPRVLAIQAEPPQPRTGTATTLQALVYLPPVDGGADVTYSWSWCPLATNSNNAYACPITHDEFAQFYAALDLGTAPAFDLGSSNATRTASFVNPFPAPLLASLCSGAINLYPGATGATGTSAIDGGAKSICPDGGLWGFPITIYLSISPTSLGKLDAVYTVYLPTDDTVPGNLNPILGGIQATWDNAPDGGTLAVDAQPADVSPTAIDADQPTVDAGDAVDGGDSVDGAAAAGGAPSVYVGPVKSSDGVLLDDYFSTTLPRDQRIRLHAELGPESSEALTDAQATAADYANNPELAKNGTRVLAKRDTERLDLSWFTEAGDFGSDGEGGHRTGFLGLPEDADSPFSGATDNKWTLPKSEDYKDDKARLIVVVRDNRGGVAWTTGSASLEPKP